MPNGGPDCCGNCSHNLAVQEMAHPHPQMGSRFLELSSCTLRGIQIANPFWTYCPNFTYGKRPESRDTNEEPRGWVTASGLYEGYVRIPWDGTLEPNVSVPATCEICARVVSEGITIREGGVETGFCSNRHYVQWWLNKHQDDSFRVEDYAHPEGMLP